MDRATVPAYRARSSCQSPSRPLHRLSPATAPPSAIDASARGHRSSWSMAPAEDCTRGSRWPNTSPTSASSEHPPAAGTPRAGRAGPVAEALSRRGGRSQGTDRQDRPPGTPGRHVVRRHRRPARRTAGPPVRSLVLWEPPLYAAGEELAPVLGEFEELTANDDRRRADRLLAEKVARVPAALLDLMDAGESTDNEPGNTLGNTPGNAPEEALAGAVTSNRWPPTRWASSAGPRPLSRRC